MGRGIAEVLASAGAFVYVNDLHAERADEVVAWTVMLAWLPGQLRVNPSVGVR